MRILRILAVLCFAASMWGQVPVAPLNNPHYQFLSAAGAPLAGGFVYTYAAGSSTPVATYSDALGLSLNTNPVQLDADGFATIFLKTQAYKICVQNAGHVQQWCVDNLRSLALLGKPFESGLLAARPASCSASIEYFQQTDSPYTLFQCNSAGNGWIAVTPSWLPSGIGTIGQQLTTNFGATAAYWQSKPTYSVLDYLAQGNAGQVLQYIHDSVCASTGCIIDARGFGAADTISSLTITKPTVIYFGNTVFSVTGQILIGGSVQAGNVGFIGSVYDLPAGAHPAKGTVFQRTGTATTTLLKLNNVRSSVFTNFSLDGKASGATGALIGLEMTNTNATGVSVFNVFDGITVGNATSKQIYVGSATDQQTSDSAFRNVSVYGTSTYGIYQEGSNTVAMVYDTISLSGATAAQFYQANGDAKVTNVDVAAVAGPGFVIAGDAPLFVADHVYGEGTQTLLSGATDSSIFNNAITLRNATFLWSGTGTQHVIEILRSASVTMEDVWLRTLDAPNTGKLYIHPAHGVVFLTENNNILANSPAAITRDYVNTTGPGGVSYPDGYAARFFSPAALGNQLLVDGVTNGVVTNYLLGSRAADETVGPLLCVVGNTIWGFCKADGTLVHQFDTATGGVSATSVTVSGAVSGGSLTGAMVSASASHAVCWKTTTTLGYCSDTPDAGGACTCN